MEMDMMGEMVKNLGRLIFYLPSIYSWKLCTVLFGVKF